MQRILANETPKNIGQKVKLAGWVYTRRDHGKLIFIDLLDRSGIIQLICDAQAKDLRPQDVIEVAGIVNARPKNLINPKIETGSVELKVEELKIIEKAAELPFDLGSQDLKVSLPTLLDYRALTLRHPKVRAIFEVEEEIVNSFCKTMQQLNFTQIFVPTIVPFATEGGAEVFKIKYFEHDAYLAQSPQLYKQILVGVFEKVFTIAHAYRAEPSETTRHLTEYLSLDAEMGFIDSYEQIMDVVEKVVRNFISDVSKNCQKQVQIFDLDLPKLPERSFPKIKLAEAEEVIYKRTKRDIRGKPDLDPEGEREIGRFALEKYGSDFIYVTHFPVSKRPYYTYPDPKNPSETLSFDLIGKGLEWVTGGQRINNFEKLLSNIKKIGGKVSDFEIYLQAFKYSMPKEGGFAIGAERVVMQLLNLSSIKEASLFPRDMGRVDVSLKNR